MPSLFSAVLVGAALLALAVILSVLFGLSLAHTRTNLADLQRLLQTTRRLNAAVVAAAKNQSPSVDIAKAGNKVDI